MNAGADSSLRQWFDGRARLVPCEVVTDLRGTLLPLELDRLPLRPRRMFTVAGVPAGAVRGGHGHRVGQQLLICLQGRIEALLRRGDEEARVVLLPGGPGLLVGVGVWCQQTYLDTGSVLLVLASEPYDRDSYDERWWGAA